MKKQIWPWGPLDAGRVDRARKVKLDSLDQDSCTCRVVGSSGAVYDASLSSCTCPDFAIKHGAQPCKHIINIAISTGFRDSKYPHWENPYEHWLFENK